MVNGTNGKGTSQASAPIIPGFQVTTRIAHEDPIVRDHRVHDTRIMPGVVFLDMACRALSRYVDPPKLELRHVVFREPIVTTEAFDRAIRLRFVPPSAPVLAQDEVTLLGELVAESRRVRGSEVLSDFSENFRCQVALHDGKHEVERHALPDLGAAVRVMDLDEAYAVARRLSITHHAFMKGQGRLFDLGDALWAQIHLSEEASAFEEHFHIHPALLDASTLVPAIYHHRELSSVKPFIPIFIERFCVGEKLRGSCFVRVPKPTSWDFPEDVIYGDHQIYDAQGKLVASFERLTGKRIRGESLITRLQDERGGRAEPSPKIGAPKSREPIALPRAHASHAAQGHACGVETVEQELIALLQEVLHDPSLQIEPDLGFYDLGLDSTHLLGLVRKLEQRIGQELYPTLLFEQNTVRKLAAFLWQEYSQAFLTPALQGSELASAQTVPSVQSETLLCASRFVAQERQGDSPEQDGVIWWSRAQGTPSAEEVAALPRANTRLVMVLPDEPAEPALGERVTAVIAPFHEALRAFVAGTEGPMRVLCVGRGHGSALCQGVAAFLRSIGVEHPRLGLTLLSVSAEASDATCRSLALRELAGDVESWVRYTGGQREVLRREQVPSGEASELPIRPGAGYVISGGAGGLGLIFARAITARGGRVCLLGRRSPDEKLRRVLAELGDHAEYLSVDVSDPQAVMNACAHARARFGGLRGVIHSAGVLRDGMFGTQGFAEVRDVLAPKLAIEALDRATEHDPLDLFCACSSASVLTGNLGQSAYTLANGLVDGFIAERAERAKRGERAGRSLSVQWPLWADGGMQVSDDVLQGIRRRTGLLPLPNEAGLVACSQALSSGESEVAVLHGDAARIRSFYRLQPPSVERSLKATLPSAQDMKHAASASFPIAIVGLSGRYPGAPDLETFWSNLISGVDSITEVPEERWALDGFFDADPDQARAGRSYSRWGGFLSGVDHFDPQFFGLSPREAEFMDPQERLFLQTAWSTFEDASLRPSTLRSRRVGVFVGAMWSQYPLLGFDGGVPKPLGGSFASIANRVSFLLDLKGPSVAVDTMCSSSLSAIHLACRAIADGECEMALAGGVNVQPHPVKYVQLSQARMLATDGRCRSFGEGGSGYVPAEGVGCVLLKPLHAALSDGDHVRGVILASALNHGGRTAGFSVPEPSAQADAIADALQKAGIDGRAVSYVEAHGTGTSLGDPIEVSGLARALGTEPREPCAVGSVKSNIGHAESAAAIAGLTKIVLQLEHGQLAPSLHADVLNPQIDFARAQLRVPTEVEPWKGRLHHDGKEVRIAGLSSFGAGGTNGHLIVAEAPAQEQSTRPVSIPEGGVFVPLSARTRERLQAYATRLSDFLQRHPAPLADIAFTLRRGREPMRHRLVVAARTLDGLICALRSFNTSADEGSIWTGEAKPQVSRARGPLSGNAPAQWVSGVDLDWDAIQPLAGARLLSLPTYPFAQHSYWPRKSTLKTSSTRSEACTVNIDPTDALIREHRVNGTPWLAGAHQVSLLWQQAQYLFGAVELEQVTFRAPLPVTCACALTIVSTNGAGHPMALELREEQGSVVASARFRAASTPSAPKLDLAAIRARCNNEVGHETLYARLMSAGLEYGQSYRRMAHAHIGANEALVKLGSPAPLDQTQTLDAALQAIAAIHSEGTSRALPFALRDVVRHRAQGEVAWVHVKELPPARDERCYALHLLDTEGEVLLAVGTFATRETRLVRSSQAGAYYYEPRWVSVAQSEEGKVKSPGSLLWLLPAGRDEVDHDWAKGAGITFLRASHDADSSRSVHPLDASSWARLLDALEESESPRSLVCELDLVADGQHDAEDAAQIAELQRGLFQALALRGGRLSAIAFVSSRRPQDMSMAACASAFAKSAVQELSDLTVVCCEWVRDTRPSFRELASAVLSELRTPSHDYVRWVGEAEERATRQVLVWHPVQPPATTSAFVERGVYVITGALGGVGRALACYLAETRHARLVLVGRAPESEAQTLCDQVKARGGEATYVRADICDAQQVAELARVTRERFGEVDSVFHAAGARRDGLLRSKSTADLTSVLGPKVRGSVLLAEAFRELQPRRFVSFSSLSAIFGNLGQADYAFANAFQAAFSARQMSQQEGTQYLCIDWPLLELAGMQMDARLRERLLEEMGLTALSASEALLSLERACAQPARRIAVASGARDKLDQAFAEVHAFVHARDELTADALRVETPTVDASVQMALLATLRRLLAEENHLDSSTIETDEPLETYGVDSVVVMNITRRLEEHLGTLPKTLFFQYRTLNELAEFLARDRGQALARWLGSPASQSIQVAQPLPVCAAQAPVPQDLGSLRTLREQNSSSVADSDVAIIGLAGRYPGAVTLAEFWLNLAQGRDCIEEVPRERWDHRDHFDPEPGKAGKSYTRWGGFVRDVDKFDPLFFGLAPRDAELMDPQERLFLQTAWEAMEDAGYCKRALEGRAVGVYVGVMWGQYQLLRKSIGEASVSPGAIYASVANRVSFCLDLRGPSMALDTMCSSSLTALHLACESLRRGESELAFAGGVNLTLHPSKYELLSFQRFAASHGRCRAFGQGGDGYVPGEGVGAVLLKPLSRALEDGDHVYGVIRGSALNHGGRAPGFVVPNPNAQAAVISRALQEAGVAATDLSYVEAHGTGTALGDPIEVAGLSSALGLDAHGKACAIGSLKSNIGHLEAAAGIASLTKVLLQLKQRTLVPSIHTETLNPHIDFESAGLCVQRSLSPWDGANRVASVSGFGAGGSNAHVVVQEAPPVPELPASAATPQLILLSAKTEERLKVYAERWLAAVQDAQTWGPGGGSCAERVARLKEVLSELLALELTDLSEHLPLSELGVGQHEWQRFIAAVSERGLGSLPVDVDLLRCTLLHVSQRLMVIDPESDERARAWLRDAAYTSQVGRDAFEVRLAIVARSLHELSRALQAYVAGDSAAAGLWQGVADDRSVRNLLSGEEGQAYAKALLDNGKIERLAQLWSRGADCSFHRLHATGTARRISLPTYPFAPESYWVGELGRHDRVPPQDPASIQAFAATFPLPVDSITLSEHLWLGRPTLPAVASCELALRGAAQLWPHGKLALSDCRFERPVQPTSDAVVRIDYQRLASGNLSFELSLEGGPVCVRGCVARAEALDQAHEAQSVLPSHPYSDGELLYRRLEGFGLSYGPAFRRVQRFARLAEACFAKLEPITHGAVPVIAVLDAGLQLLAVLQEEGARAGVPCELQRLEVDASRLTQATLAQVRRRDDGRYDVHILTHEGSCVASLRGVRLAENPGLTVSPAVPSVESALACLEPIWTLEQDGSASSQPPSGPVLIVGPRARKDLMQEIARVHEHGGATLACIGSRTRATNAGWELAADDPSAFQKLFAALHSSSLARIYFIDTSEANEEGPGAALALLRLIQAAYRVQSKQRPQLVALTINAQAVGGSSGAHAGSATLFGFLSAAAQELGIEAACVDLPDEEATTVAFTPRPTLLFLWSWLRTLFAPKAIRLPSSATDLAVRVAHTRASDRPEWVALRADGRWRLTPSAVTMPQSHEEPYRDRGVYLIVGGASGVGLSLARQLARRYRARLAIVGRAARQVQEDPALSELVALGAEVLYCRADVSNEREVAGAVARCVAHYGALHGVIHSAAVLEDQTLLRMSEAQLRATLAAKVDGTRALWNATARHRPDWFCLFSSAQAFRTNPGQANYAAGNAFQDAFVRSLRAQGESAPRCVYWGYFGTVGAAATKGVADRFATMGIGSLEPDEALTFLRAFLVDERAQLMLLRVGNSAANQTLPRVLPESSPVGAAIALTSPEGVEDVPHTLLSNTSAPILNISVEVRARVVEVIAGVVRVPRERVRDDETFEHYGVDSLASTEIVRRLADHVGELPATLLFEQPSVGRLTQYLCQMHREACARWVEGARTESGPAPTAQRRNATKREEVFHEPMRAEPSLRDAKAIVTRPLGQDIAIVGMSARLPGAADVHALWQNLKQGVDAISEVPRERFDFTAHDGKSTSHGTVHARFGGFIEDVDAFDAKFFRITPFEAELLDPQERLFLETAWSAIEDAGYTPEALGGTERLVSVHVGVMNHHYSVLGGEAWGRGQSHGAASSYWSVANRVSYLLDFKGPSLAVDTACSSSLVAVHLACESLRNGEAKVAIAGGVNVILHPQHFYRYSAMHMLSPSGRCRSFGAGADGIVLGEGVGAVVLKPLSDAIADGDHIYAVIKGSAVNSGGKTPGFTVPNPDAQRQVVQTALGRAGVDARTIGCIEAHGTGTELGDPIEVRALSQVFEGAQGISLGSLKSNLGHLESAAGVAGLIKAVLQTQHKTLVPTLHAQDSSPKLDFGHLPFRLQRDCSPWEVPREGTPRRAGVSSFGAGGVNAHVVIEEHLPREGSRPSQHEPVLLTLSAQDVPSLRAYGARLLSALQSSEQPLEDVAYTLQMGRVPLNARLAIVAEDAAHAQKLLTLWLDGLSDDNIHEGTVDTQLTSHADAPADLTHLARQWVSGMSVDFSVLHAGRARRRLSLPTYPFARTRFLLRVDAQQPLPAPNPVSSLHPLLQENTSTLHAQCYTTRLSDRCALLADHRVFGRAMLPAAAIIELTRAAAELALDKRVVALEDLVFGRGLVTTDGVLHLRTLLCADADGVRFEGRESDDAQGPCFRGRAQYEGDASFPPVRVRDLEGIAARLPHHIEADAFYERMASAGLRYGAGYRVIERIVASDDEALSYLALPDCWASEGQGYTLHPALLDGALQSVAAVVAPRANGSYLPYGVSTVRLRAELNGPCAAHVRLLRENKDAFELDVDLLSPQGEPLLSLEGLVLRAVSLPRPQVIEPTRRDSQDAQVTLLSPHWEIEAAHTDPRVEVHDLLLFDVDGRLREEIAAAEPNVRVVLVRPGEAFAQVNEREIVMRPDAAEDHQALLDVLCAMRLVPDRIIHLWSLSSLSDDDAAQTKAWQHGFGSVFQLLRALSTEGFSEGIRLLYVHPAQINEIAPVYAAVGGLLKSLWWEDPRMLCKAVGMSSQGLRADGPERDRALSALLQELVATAREGTEVLLLEGERRVRKLSPVSSEPHGDRSPFRPGGTYLITGGMGQLGTLCARHLAKHAAARLILTGRSAPDARTAEALHALRALGATDVTYIPCDHTSPDDVTALVTRVHTQVGAIHGVLHCAGVTHDRLLKNKTLDEARAVLAVKVQGARLLDQALSQEALDCFVLFSSLSSIRGNAGQTDYAAANAYLDAFAHVRDRQVARGERFGRTKVVNWPLWETAASELPEGVVAWMRDTFGILPLDEASGLRALEEALGAERVQTVVVKQLSQHELASAAE